MAAADKRALFHHVDDKLMLKLEAAVRKLIYQRERALEFKRPMSEIYHQPDPGTTKIKPEAYKLYEAQIKVPMDLRTVEKTLEEDLEVAWAEKKYLCAEDCAHDVRLIWRNAFMFPMYKDTVENAWTLGRQFEEAFNEILAAREQLPDAPGIPLKDRCRIILADLRRNPLSEFCRKDDWKALEPNYSEVIRNGRTNLPPRTIQIAKESGIYPPNQNTEPMDLDEVQRRFDAGQYNGAGASSSSAAAAAASSSSADGFDINAFAKDVRQIFLNGVVFNDVKTPVGRMFDVLSHSFEAQLKRAKEAKTPQGAADARRRELLTECSKLQEKSALEIGNLLRKRVPEAVSQEGTVNLDKVADDIDDASLETLIKRAKSEQQ